MRHKLVCAFLAVFALFGVEITAKAQTYTDMYNFSSAIGDPIQPQYTGAIAQGRDGNLYTTISFGGEGCGAAVKMTTTGTLSTYSFQASNGCIPLGGLTLGTDGNLYGTTQEGGANCCNGVVFKMSPTGTISVLYNFTGGNDGCYPLAAPIQGTDGNWYGTTSNCGQYGGGTIYKLTPAGAFTALYQFDGGANGGSPHAPLVQGTDGNLYGTALSGGSSFYGTAFKVSTTGKLVVIHNFDTTSGGYPYSPLIQAIDGNFYGTTADYGSLGGGVIYKLTPAGSYSVIHNMNFTADGETPFAGLVQASDGKFYGANYGSTSGFGTLFNLGTTGTLTVLYNFDSVTGAQPEVTPVQHTNGMLYGDTYSGGTGNLSCAVGTCGVFYSLNNSLPAFAGLVTTVGKVGSKVGILGQGFSSSSVVTFGTTPATSVTLSGTTFLSATVPSGATTATVSVTTSSGTLKSLKKFRVAPQINTFSPPAGPDGTVVTITGVSLTQTQKVAFGGVPATTFTVVSDTQVNATVPTGAKTGKISIATAGGTVNSTGTFTVQPSIASFTPTNGTVGTAVTINGGGFTGATAVKFNGTSATFTVNSDAKITTSVPSGATTGPISVTTPGGTATSSTNFTVN